MPHCASIQHDPDEFHQVCRKGFQAHLSQLVIYPDGVADTSSSAMRSRPETPSAPEYHRESMLDVPDGWPGLPYQHAVDRFSDVACAKESTWFLHHGDGPISLRRPMASSPLSQLLAIRSMRFLRWNLSCRGRWEVLVSAECADRYWRRWDSGNSG
ncbi:hypothetical protein OIDMADRAFT_177454 [Oidiodendron maius Zn]|uniref:Uncharacterized protein n=1 Tax=Oidiodendron maius (strain Zn) TaxID=913774 RepID=A0A0C3DSV8_OIDMZ|nr:hypothetical protein OIDMADRAFT_177454 [Oidiodendron maius Zn]